MGELYSNNDWRYYLSHSWGTSPAQKLREKEYNKAYYEAHKVDKWGIRGDRKALDKYINSKAIQPERFLDDTDTFDKQEFKGLSAAYRAIDKAVNKLQTKTVQYESDPDVDSKLTKKLSAATNNLLDIVFPHRLTNYYRHEHDNEWEAVEERILPDGSKTYIKTAELLAQDKTVLRKARYRLSSKNLDKMINDASSVNPNYLDGGDGSRHNCPYCVAAMALRLKGYDVSARKSIDGASASGGLRYWFNMPKDNLLNGQWSFDKSGAEQILKQLKPGSYGAIDHSSKIGSDHVSFWFKTTDNKLVFLDPQSNSFTSKYYPNLSVQHSISELIARYDIDEDKHFGIIDLTKAVPNFQHMAKDSVITANENKSTIRYRNKYNKNIVDEYGDDPKARRR